MSAASTNGSTCCVRQCWNEPSCPIEDIDEAAFDFLIGLTLRGHFFLLKHALRLIPDSSAIILTSSTAALRGMVNTSIYGAGKATSRALGVNLAVELAPRKTRVNTITPEPIATNFGQNMNLNEK